MTLPEIHVPNTPEGWEQAADIATWNWDGVPALPPFQLADGSGLAEQQTTARVCHDAWGLYVRFDCADRDIWCSYTRRDEPIYDEEVVEVFLGPGADTPTRYYEFEISPNGVLLDALIENPTSQRADLRVDFGWDCQGLRWQAVRDDAAGHWWAVLAIPWAALVPAGERPPVWRANFFRIERPRDAAPEFSCWSPTMTDPADFHKPAYFGKLEIRD
jgi:hypothetical protein